MTSYKDALVLLNDLDKFAETHGLHEAEELILKARQALENDLGNAFPPVRKLPKPSRVYPILQTVKEKTRFLAS